MEGEHTITIRRFVALLDYDLVCSWWQHYEMPFPRLRDIPFNTFIAELDELPALCLSVVKTDVSHATLENFVAHPELESPLRRDAAKALVEHAERVARELGFRGLFCLAPNAGLNSYYETFGFRTTAAGMFTMVKEI
jgi:hypothetical protein